MWKRDGESGEWMVKMKGRKLYQSRLLYVILYMVFYLNVSCKNDNFEKFA
jgi:hypothetical protein